MPAKQAIIRSMTPQVVRAGDVIITQVGGWLVDWLGGVVGPACLPARLPAPPACLPARPARPAGPACQAWELGAVCVGAAAAHRIPTPWRPLHHPGITLPRLL